MFISLAEWIILTPERRIIFCFSKPCKNRFKVEGDDVRYKYISFIFFMMVCIYVLFYINTFECRGFVKFDWN